MNLEAMISDILGNLKSIAKTETIIGEEFKLGEYSCRPVMKVNLGIGGGGAEGDKEKEGKGVAGGSGGGVNVEPVGFLAAHGDEIKFINSAGKRMDMSKLFEKMPEIVDKLQNFQKGKNKKKEDEE